MRPVNRIKLIYGFLLGFIGLVVWQQLRFLFRPTGELGLQCTTMMEVAFYLIAGYSVIRIIGTVARQWYLSRDWNRSSLLRIDTQQSERLQNRYKHWNIKIMVIRDTGFFALSAGYLRPRIVISTAALEMFEEDEIEAILLHERYHCIRRDNLKLFLSALLQNSFGYLPIVKPVLQYCKTWMELLADRYAMDTMKSSYHLGQVLLKLARAGIVRKRMDAVQFAETAMDYRMLQIAEPETPIEVPLKLFRPMMVSICFLLLLMLSGSS